MHVDLEVDLDGMFEVFGEPDGSLSHPELGDYWFAYRRPDGVVVRLVLGLFDRKVIVGVDYGVAASVSLVLENCDHVRILEASKRTLEVVAAASSIRCFLALEGQSVMAMEAPTRP